MMDGPAHEFSVYHDCAVEGCIEPNYDARVRDLVKTQRGTSCLCHPNVNRVLHGNHDGVYDCSCGTSHAICLDCLADPNEVTREEIRAVKERYPELSTAEAVVRAYEEKALVRKFQTIKIEPLQD